ncbi:MAG: GAF domain-containing protein [Chloroflexota bacterium]
MISSQSSISSLFLPNGEFQVPVCVGDMPSYDYWVSVDTMTESVTAHLETHPDIPGVILLDQRGLHSAIPRSRIFERLGHRYGVELFLRKPILELQKNLRMRTYTVSSNMRIQDAVQIALERPLQDIYDPLVVLYDNGEMRLLEMHVLLFVQSYALRNVHNLMGSLASLEWSIETDSPFEEILPLSLDSLRRVVPFHQVMVHVKSSCFHQLPGKHGVLHVLDEQIAYDIVFQVVLNTQQSLHIEDVHMVPAWEDFALFDGVRCWMGVPLLNSGESLGLVSVMRCSYSPFTKDEMNMAKAFAELIAIALHKAMRMKLQSEQGDEGSSLDSGSFTPFEYTMEQLGL